MHNHTEFKNIQGREFPDFMNKLKYSRIQYLPANTTQKKKKH